MGGIVPFQWMLSQPEPLKGVEFHGQRVYEISRDFVYQDQALIASTRNYQARVHFDGKVEVYEGSSELKRKLRQNYDINKGKFDDDGNLTEVESRIGLLVIVATGPYRSFNLMGNGEFSDKQLKEFFGDSEYLWKRFAELEESVNKFKKEPLIQSELEKLAQK
ncbi:hypothetical protein ACFLUF_02540 [Chloroflexota bacterium]